ncbi:MAG: NAD(P)/FAD-dependent oxidoreductase [Xenococcus sp. (in: cyanobacteria)]
MKNYDWIVIGAGITGSALAYELSKQKFSVLLLEKDAIPRNATLYSYGGLAYWSGKTDLTRQLAKEGIELHRHLAEELAGDTEFRELDLLLTIAKFDDPDKITRNYQHFAIAPQLLNVQEACELEPLLNPDAIAGALRLPHAHIHPQNTTQAYQAAFLGNGGVIQYESVIDLIRQENNIQGVKTKQNSYYSAHTVVCAGGLTRSLLQERGIPTKTYFTHALLIKTPPVDLELKTIVMPAVQQRFALEATASDKIAGSAWERSKPEVIQSILDPGVVQFRDRSLCLGQISAIATDPKTDFNLELAESQIRQQLATILPKISEVPGTCHHCLVAFSDSAIANVGAVESLRGLYLFTGFTSPLVFAPAIARRFASNYQQYFVS